MSVLTFLFTDIEGSTRRWEADADAMRVALDAHNKVLREAVDANDGKVFNYTGDGMCAVFASPRSAVDAAVDAQRALELPVRMGVATGEAELRGDDYFGTVLNRAARVMAAGHGGQILLDGATAALIGGLDLLDLGPRRLRDITNLVNVFQVRASGVRAEFPPLKTVDPTPGNLRLPNTSLIGRESALAELETELKAHCVVTLTGVGGVGKTRLALEIAAQVRDGFPDGVWVIELAPVGDPAAVPEAVAAILGITQQPGLSVADSVAAALEGRSRLLVFDNCEHVLDAAADMIEAIIARSGTVRILATSREGLGVADEQLWPVPSLDINSTATSLFVERAAGVAPGLSLTVGPEAESVEEICRRLDGIPLAIELAASRMQSMTATELRARLDDRFRLLVGSRRGLERHQTLHHAVQWSYDLLDDAEKALLTGCSVFAGGFDLAAACAVVGSGDELATLDLLHSLVRKSLLVADRSSATTRFSMLETIRQFGEEQLVASGGAEEARTAHARYFAGREVDVMKLWDSQRQREAYEWFTVELANLRTAFRWAADGNDLDTAAAIAVYASFLGTWVDQNEASGWAEELIEPAQAVQHRRLAQVYVMAAEAYPTGRFKDAGLGYAEAGYQAIASGRFDEVPAEAEAALGAAYIMVGRPSSWVQLCRNMIARDTGPHIFTQACLVLALEIAGDTEESIAAADDLFAVIETTDNPAVRCHALLAYGRAYRDVDPSRIYEICRRSMAIAHSSGNRQIEAQFAVLLSSLASTHSDPKDALALLTRAIRTHYDTGSFGFMHPPLAVLAVLFDRLGRYEPAATISGFTTSPMARIAYSEVNTAITHLRGALGDQAYESFARAGEYMTNAAMATYAFEQIDLARAELRPAGDPL